MQRHNFAFVHINLVSVSLERGRGDGRGGGEKNGTHAHFNSIYGLLRDTQDKGSDGYHRKMDATKWPGCRVLFRSDLPGWSDGVSRWICAYTLQDL